MRFRGLPRELNCGIVDIRLANHEASGPPLPVCGPCGFVSMNYYLLAGCGHVACESCALVYSEKDGETDEEQEYSSCSTCHEISEATRMKISVTALEKTIFQCPCGVQGTLKELHLHRIRCQETEWPSVAEDSFVRVSPLRAQRSSSVDVEAVSARVKEILLEELQRVEEDVLNRLEVNRSPRDAEVGTLTRKVQTLEIQTQVLRLDMQRQAAQFPAMSAASTEVQRIGRLVQQLQDQVNRLPAVPAASQELISRAFVSYQSTSCVMWFNVKKLLQKFNRTGVRAVTEEHEVLLGGYPCGINLEIDLNEGRKMLGMYVGTSNIPNQAEWPMRRKILLKIYGADGNVFKEDNIDTIDRLASNFFHGPNSTGTFGVRDMCTVEELTNEQFYRRNHGMLCVGIQLCDL